MQINMNNFKTRKELKEFEKELLLMLSRKPQATSVKPQATSVKPEDLHVQNSNSFVNYK